MIIERETTHVVVVKDDQLLDSVKRINEGPIWGIVGIINLAALNYLVVISNADVVAKLNKVNIYKVTGVRIIPFKVSTVCIVSKILGWSNNIFQRLLTR